MAQNSAPFHPLPPKPELNMERQSTLDPAAMEIDFGMDSGQVSECFTGYKTFRLMSILLFFY